MKPPRNTFRWSMSPWPQDVSLIVFVLLPSTTAFLSEAHLDLPPVVHKMILPASFPLTFILENTRTYHHQIFHHEGLARCDLPMNVI